MSKTDINKNWFHPDYSDYDSSEEYFKEQKSFEASQNNESYKKFAMSKKASYKRKMKRGKRK